LRKFGAKKGVLSTQELDPKKLVKQAKESPGLIGRDLVKEVSCDKPYRWSELPYNLDQPAVDSSRLAEEQMKLHETTETSTKSGIPIAALDCGIKYNILRKLTAEGFVVTVFPANTQVEGLMNRGFKGVFLSNGPGDPEGVPYVIETVRQLIEKNVPTFGICLGHQILGLALGGKTYKLKFGHRGGNQPVFNTINQKVEITSQNHGFAVDNESLNKEEVTLSHINLSDNTSEGMALKKKPVFSVQYHPEASPGPHDANYLFKQFRELVERNG
jgi:carbamoyl-phosphate synthase small subunit